MFVGQQYRLNRPLTALEQGMSGPTLCKLPPGTLLKVAAVVRFSGLVQVEHGGKIYEVFADDLADQAIVPDPDQLRHADGFRHACTHDGAGRCSRNSDKAEGEQ